MLHEYRLKNREQHRKESLNLATDKKNYYLLFFAPSPFNWIDLYFGSVRAWDVLSDVEQTSNKPYLQDNYGCFT